MTTPPVPASATASEARVIIGRRTLRTLMWLLLVVVLATITAMVMGQDMFIILLVVVSLVGWLLVVAPGVMFLCYSLMHRGEAVGRGLRRSATESGVVAILLGVFALLVTDPPVIRAIGLAVGIIGVAVIVRAWRAPRSEPDAPERVRLSHKWPIATGFVLALLVLVMLPKFRGVTPESAYRAAARSDLRNLAMAQEAFFADSARYTTNLSSLAFYPSSGATPPVITVGPGWWSATNATTRVPNIVCGIAVNTANPVIGKMTEFGEPECR